MKIKSIVITSELGYFARNTSLFDRVREQKVTIEESGNVKINSVTFRNKTKESNFVISEEDIGKLFRKFEETFESDKETLQVLDAGIWTVCIETESTRKEYRGSVHVDCFNELSTTLRWILGEWNLIAFDGKTKDIEAVGDEYTYYFVWIERVGKCYSYLANEEYEIGDWVEVPFGYGNKVVKGRIDDIEVYTEEEAPWPPEKTKYIIGRANHRKVKNHIEEYSEEEFEYEYGLHQRSSDEMDFEDVKGKVKTIIITSGVGYFSRHEFFGDKDVDQEIIIESSGVVRLNSITARDRIRKKVFNVDRYKINEIFQLFEKNFENYEKGCMVYEAGIWTVLIESEEESKTFTGFVTRGSLVDLSRALRLLLKGEKLIAFDGDIRYITNILIEYPENGITEKIYVDIINRDVRLESEDLRCKLSEKAIELVEEIEVVEDFSYCRDFGRGFKYSLEFRDNFGEIIKLENEIPNGFRNFYKELEKVLYAKAYEYFNKGSLLKDKICLYKLGDMYLNGYYVEKDEEFAYELYKRARDEMDFEDMVDDGDIYLRLGRAKLKGQGTERDLDEAMEYLCLAYPMIWKNRKRNPFSKDVAEYCKELIEECEEAMEEEWVELY